MNRRALVLLLAAFLATRGAAAWLADHPAAYQGGGSIIGDVTLYQYWGEQIADHGAAPYRDVSIEYPPGALPFIVGPALVGPFSYRTVYIALMLLVDAAGMIGLLLIARRWGSLLGPGLWVGLIPLIGPVTYLRLDLVPAVATIWAVERISKASWRGAGAWLGFGAVAKLYPLVLLPPIFVFSSRRKRLAGGALVAVILALLPFAGWGRSLARSVVRYHLERGIEIESLWGAVLLLASKLGLAIRMDFSFESLNVISSLSPSLKLVAGILLLAGVGAATWVAARAAASRQDERLAEIMFATLAIVVALATVLSPQYILWLAAAGAAAACSPTSSVRMPVLLLAPIALLTQAIFPFLFVRLASAEPLALTTLVIRNLLLLVVAAWALVAVASRDRSEGPAEAGGPLRARPDAASERAS
jgi:hypothetical protein